MAGRPPARSARRTIGTSGKAARKLGAQHAPVEGGLAQRRAIGVGLLLAQGLMQLALAFDIQWHRSIGRDNFRIPPHLVLSVGVGALGGLCLAVVLRSSWSNWRGRTPGEGQFVTVFGLFRAPIGAVLGGFGALITGVASLLDNVWWHGLYGPDFILWAPFHTMGLLGAILTATGIAYLWGDLARDDPHPAAIWGLRVAIVAVLGHLLVLAEPGTWQFPGLTLGPLRVATAPLLLLALAPWPLIVAGRIGAAWGAVSVVVLLLTRDLLVEGIVPLIVREGAALTGATIRPSVPPRFRAEIIAGDLLLLLAAWPLDWLRSRGVTRLAPLCAIVIPPLWIAGLLLTLLASDLNRSVTFPGLDPAASPLTPGGVFLALPLGALLAVASAQFGATMADLLRGVRR